MTMPPDDPVIPRGSLEVFDMYERSDLVKYHSRSNVHADVNSAHLTDLSNVKTKGLILGNLDPLDLRLINRAFYVLP